MYILYKQTAEKDPTPFKQAGQSAVVCAKLNTTFDKMLKQRKDFSSKIKS